jgi:hypothetical protein
MPSDQRVIRASEIGEYEFCHRAWWLHRICGLESANRAQMQAGTANHIQHGRAVQTSALLNRVAIILFGLAAFVAAILILSALAK